MKGKKGLSNIHLVEVFSLLESTIICDRFDLLLKPNEHQQLIALIQPSKLESVILLLL